MTDKNAEFELLKMQHSQEIAKVIRERDEAINKADELQKRMDNIIKIIDNIDSVAQVTDYNDVTYRWADIMESPHGWCYRIRCEASV